MATDKTFSQIDAFTFHSQMLIELLSSASLVNLKVRADWYQNKGFLQTETVPVHSDWSCLVHVQSDWCKQSKGGQSLGPRQVCETEALEEVQNLDPAPCLSSLLPSLLFFPPREKHSVV